MFEKQYTNTNKDISFNYSLNTKKWEFKSEQYKYTFLTKVKGGFEAAHKIANFISGALKRTKGQGIDGMARKNIAAYTN